MKTETYINRKRIPDRYKLPEGWKRAAEMPKIEKHEELGIKTQKHLESAVAVIVCILAGMLLIGLVALYQL